ncbi:VTT domain-containing protein [Methylobacterium nigriterrae]|uniref:VTT domain-containing protein n=1 Tax=Methylobacterium nigriterrae TaxID=3127512 RepID=UPI00301371D5
MLDQLPALLLLFGLVFGLNVVPVFAPPTWMALAFVGFEFPEASIAVIALLGAAAATLGRLTLAKLSHRLVRERLLDKEHRENIDEIKQRLEARTRLTASLFLFYAFSPLPSNLLFIAYGLTALPLWRAALPFLIGRSASYGFFVTTGAAAGRRLSIDSTESAFYAGIWFIVSQLVVIGALFIFTHLDWRTLFQHHRLTLVTKSGLPASIVDRPKKGAAEAGSGAAVSAQRMPFNFWRKCRLKRLFRVSTRPTGAGQQQ